MVNELAPGMTQVIYAGETIEIQDANNQTFEIEGREHEDTIAFIEVFDQWFVAKQNNVVGPVLDSLWESLMFKWTSLPAHIIRNLPSIKSLGIKL